MINLGLEIGVTDCKELCSECNPYACHRAVLNCQGVSKVIRVSFYFTVLYRYDWVEKLARATFSANHK